MTRRAEPDHIKFTPGEAAVWLFIAAIIVLIFKIDVRIPV